MTRAHDQLLKGEAVSESTRFYEQTRKEEDQNVQSSESQWKKSSLGRNSAFVELRMVRHVFKFHHSRARDAQKIY